MKKLYEQIKEKALLGIVMIMLTTGGAFLWNTGKDLWNLPSTVRELKSSRTQDSIQAVKYIIKIDSISKVVKNHQAWLDEDYLLIQKIKVKLKIK